APGVFQQLRQRFTDQLAVGVSVQVPADDELHLSGRISSAKPICYRIRDGCETRLAWVDPTLSDGSQPDQAVKHLAHVLACRPQLVDVLHAGGVELGSVLLTK